MVLSRRAIALLEIVQVQPKSVGEKELMQRRLWEESG
jgi:hypothetical protein